MTKKTYQQVYAESLDAALANVPPERMVEALVSAQHKVATSYGRFIAAVNEDKSIASHPECDGPPTAPDFLAMMYEVDVRLSLARQAAAVDCAAA
jgi:hypothetical protein